MRLRRMRVGMEGGRLGLLGDEDEHGKGIMNCFHWRL